MSVKRTKYIDLQKVVRDSAGPATLAVAKAGAGRAKALAPVDKAILRNSIQAKQEGPKRSSYGTNVVYAMIQEFGGIIRAVTAKYLKFQIKGKWVATKSVTIPPSPYLRPSADWLKTQGSKVYATVLRRALNRG